MEPKAGQRGLPASRDQRLPRTTRIRGDIENIRQPDMISSRGRVGLPRW
jgi:hypothetical protein